jgi:hypothetical protein
MKKIPVWLLALALTAVGAAGTIGYGYQKANDEGINGTVNIITSQAIGVQSITFGTNWVHEDDSAVGVVAEDHLSYIIGLQLNNGDEYFASDNQEVKITLENWAKTTMIVKLTTEFGITQPDQADCPCDDIHIWYSEVTGETVGQLDPWTYYVEIEPATASAAGTVVLEMNIDVGNIIAPGFYTFTTYLEPTNWGALNSAQMD